MSIATSFIKYGKNVLVEKAKDKAKDTVNKATASIQHGLNKEVNNVINNATNMPQDFYREAMRNFNVESTRATFQHNPNQSTYDYFNDYYSHYNKRYSPTPTPNLAQQLRQHELNLNKHRLFR